MMFQPIAPGSTDHWLALAAELAPLARESEDWEALGIAAEFRAAIAYVHADPDAWSDAISDLDRAVRGSGQPLLAHLRGCNDYAHAFLRGDFAAAERIAEDLVEIGRSFGPDATEGPYGLQMYMVRRETGALEAVRPSLRSYGWRKLPGSPACSRSTPSSGSPGRPRACCAACWRARMFRRLGSSGGENGSPSSSSSSRPRSRCAMPTPPGGCGPCWPRSPAGSLSPASSSRSSAPQTPTSPRWTRCSATTSQPSGCSSRHLTRTACWGQWSTGPRSWPRGPAICVRAGTCHDDMRKCWTRLVGWRPAPVT